MAQRREARAVMTLLEHRAGLRGHLVDAAGARWTCAEVVDALAAGRMGGRTAAWIAIVLGTIVTYFDLHRRRLLAPIASIGGRVLDGPAGRACWTNESFKRFELAEHVVVHFAARFARAQMRAC